MTTGQSALDEIARKGEALFDQGRYEQATEAWEQGLAMLPQPPNSQSEAVWFQASIGDAHFMLGQFEKAYERFLEAKSNITGTGYDNPFVMLRLGECCYELDIPDSREYLLRAYLLEGKEIFEGEDEKYLEHIKDLLNDA